MRDLATLYGDEWLWRAYGRLSYSVTTGQNGARVWRAAGACGLRLTRVIGTRSALTLIEAAAANSGEPFDVAVFPGAEIDANRRQIFGARNSRAV